VRVEKSAFQVGSAFRIQADVVVASPTTFYCPGQVAFHSGRIVEVSDQVDQAAHISLAGYALLPGLVNAHTHLEFSDLRAPLPPGEDFPQWIGSVLAARLGRSAAGASHLLDALAAGLRESRDFGVAAVVDIVTPPWSPEHLGRAALMSLDDSSASVDEKKNRLPSLLSHLLNADEYQLLQRHLPPLVSMPRVVACLEQLGLTTARIETATQWRRHVESVERAGWPANLHSLGLSPHAPYSTPSELWQATLHDAAEQNKLAAMHVAESPAERCWIDDGTGPFAQLHQRLGVAEVKRSATLVADLAMALASVPYALLIHGNYLTECEIDAIANVRDRVTVVYCPRTHQHFQHDPYPLAALRQRGIRVVLGTDSRSSNPDLNLWMEARAALEDHPSFTPLDALASITEQAASACGLQSDFGTLQEGKLAAMCAIPLERDELTKAQQSANLNTVDLRNWLLARWFTRLEHPIGLF